MTVLDRLPAGQSWLWYAAEHEHFGSRREKIVDKSAEIAGFGVFFNLDAVGGTEGEDLAGDGGVVVGDRLAEDGVL